MSQNDFTIANQGFPAFRADLNSALQALASNSSGATAPSTTFANMWWYDSANNIMYIRNEDNDAWIKFAELDQTNDKFVLSGTLQLDDGTVSAPALTFNSDTNMGIYRGGTDILKFVTAGTDAITIDASQNVGIGTSSMTRFFNLYDTTTNAQTAYFKSTQASGGAGLLAYNDTGQAVTFQLNGSSNTAYGGASTLNIGSITNNPVVFVENNTERMRISSGNLLLGVTGTNFALQGFEFRNNSYMTATNSGDKCAVFNRLSTDGDILQFYKDTVQIGKIGTPGNGDVYLSSGNIGLLISGSGTVDIYPCDDNGSARDNVADFGQVGARWDDIYATNGTIQTSDRNEKQDIEELSDAEQRVAVVAKGLMRKFRWKDKVVEKGDNARTHFGIIAQDLQDAFTAEGLDAGDYAMFTSTTWWEKEIFVDAVEADEENGIEAQDAYTYMDTKDEATEGYTEKTRLGVRYNQLLAFIISAI